MENQKFEELTKEEAKAYFESFLSEAKTGFEKLVSEIQADNIDPDYTMVSIIPVFTWAIQRLNYYPVEPDLTLPSWIRNTAEYRKGLYKFDENSSILLLRISFYLGDCFIRNYPNCEWEICKTKNNAYYNMPVVIGFINNVVLSPIAVTTNIVRNTIEKTSDFSLTSVIEKWESMTN